MIENKVTGKTIARMEANGSGVEIRFNDRSMLDISNGGYAYLSWAYDKNIEGRKMRLIDANAAENILAEETGKSEIEIKYLLAQVPTVTDAEVVRQGEWLISDKIDNYGICSNCNFNTKLYFPNTDFISDYNYCPCCGAKMKKTYIHIK